MQKPRTLFLLPALLLTLAAGVLMAGAQAASADHYDELLAPRSVCPHQSDLADPISVQERAMRCMHHYARRKAHVGGFKASDALGRSADHKSADILDCQEFSHDACGHPFTYWMSRLGFSLSGCYGAGENIILGSDNRGTVRHAMSGWLHSDGHRHNILTGAYNRIGVGLKHGEYKGYEVSVWTAHFGYHC